MNAVHPENLPFQGDLARRATPTKNEDRTRWTTPSPDATQSKLKILSLDLKGEVNAKQHHTDEIDGIKGLVIRRGQDFTLELKLDQKYDGSTDKVTFDFKTGSNPVIQKRTRVYASTGSSSTGGKGWEVKISDVTENTLTVSITPDPDALVGEYSLTVRTSVSAGSGGYVELQPIYLLFNPWCKEDQVYLEDDRELEEYVLNERGLIWYGNTLQQGRQPWSFNQFEKVVFEAVMYLLQKHVKDAASGSPVLVARAMSAAVNSQDDNGVITGRWDKKYWGHTKPTKWTGSQAILEKHLRTKAPVCYGQCWVFSGVLTTVLRCLGIPTRSVTNFSSAHDTDTSLTIDKYFYPDGERATGYDSEFIWNFHVWNESWMARPDLPEGFGGWQAVDATPQETSEGIFCTGPCSVKAIKEGHVYLPYDAKFVFAEVNGDIVHWEMTGGGADPKVLKVKKHEIGVKISTKEVGTNNRKDLTLDYKHKEGSDAERAVMKLAVEHGTKPSYVYDKPEQEEDVDISVKVPDVSIGEDFDIIVPLTNKSSAHRTVSIKVTVQSCYYTGVIAKKIKPTTNKKFKLEPNESTQKKFHVDADEYMDKLVEQTGFKVIFLGHVEETGQVFGDEEDFRLRTPDLEVKLIHPNADDVHIGEKVQVEIKLTNPLKKKRLTSCEFEVEGRGLLEHTNFKHEVIRTLGTASQKVELRPFKAGKRTLVVTFESDQLSQVTGELELDVQ